LVTEAKTPTLVLSSGASITVTKPPYMVRAGFLQGQQAWIMAEWAFKNGSKRVATLVNDWAPGIESETAFKTRFTQAGGEIVESIRIPLANPDFAPFLQRVRDINPDKRLSIFRVRRPAFSPNNSPNAALAIPASRLSVLAI
jgi:branched-chain amino acid transport system substrate-binding protein